MLREEAIEVLKDLWRYEHSEFSEKDIREALDMAIRALKNEQTDGDLISRNDVIKMFNTMDRYKADKLILQDTDREFPSNEVFIVDDCYELLEQLPTYSAEQTYSWCKGCKEYDTEKHCCHRYSSFIRESLQDSINAVLEDIKAEIKQEYKRLSATRADETLELGECLGLKMSLKIIDNHISGKEE